MAEGGEGEDEIQFLRTVSKAHFMREGEGGCPFVVSSQSAIYAQINSVAAPSGITAEVWINCHVRRLILRSDCAEVAAGCGLHCCTSYGTHLSAGLSLWRMSMRELMCRCKGKMI